MRKLSFLLLAIICFFSFISIVSADELKRGDIVYARSNLRAKGSTIFWHNMSSSPVVVPVGTEVNIKAAFVEIAFITTDTNDWYCIKTASGSQWDKYFVKDKEDIGLERLPSDRKAQIENSMVMTGMSKEEVYASKGCPAYIAWGKKTFQISLNEIIKSDKWYYMANQRGHDVMVTFGNGVVVKTGGFEK